MNKEIQFTILKYQKIWEKIKQDIMLNDGLTEDDMDQDDVGDEVNRATDEEFKQRYGELISEIIKINIMKQVEDLKNIKVGTMFYDANGFELGEFTGWVDLEGNVIVYKESIEDDDYDEHFPVEQEICYIKKR